jgi:hypothetical protein
MDTAHFLLLKDAISTPNTEAALAGIAKEFPGQIVFSTSFSMEDQAITHHFYSGYRTFVF